MTACLSSIVNRPKSATVKWDDETIAITYRPYSARLEAELRQAVDKSKDDQSSMSMVRLLHKLLIGWDIEDGGQPVVPDESVLAQLPLTLLASIANAIIEGERPNLPTVVPSAAGSQQMAN